MTDLIDFDMLKTATKMKKKMTRLVIVTEIH